MDQEWSYSRSLYWRKYMTYFLLERPRLCVNVLTKSLGYTCGVELHHYPGSHYSGNFWSASCKYIRESPALQPIDATETKYTAAEFWLLRNYSHDQKHRFVGLLLYHPWRPYRYLVQPSDYVILDEHKAMQITSNLSNFNFSSWTSVLDSVVPPSWNNT
eukprot:4118107-Ditylum_brightwellii.AAC.1